MGREIDYVIDAISTNHTFFFRESSHFRFLEEQILGEFSMGQLGGNRLLTHQLIEALGTVFVVERLIARTHAPPALLRGYSGEPASGRAGG